MADLGKLESEDFETYVCYTDRAAHAESVRANDRFVLAMANAVKRGRETAVPGTFVDTSPPIGAVRIRGDAIFSACGSPAARLRRCVWRSATIMAGRER